MTNTNPIIGVPTARCVFFICGAHSSGKTTVMRRLRNEGMFDYIGSEIGKDLFYQRKFFPGNQGLQFEHEVMDLELSRDTAMLASSYQCIALETWHPGNLAYTAVRNPEILDAMTIRARQSPLLPMVNGIWLRVSRENILKRTKTFAGNASWAGDFYEKVDSEIDAILSQLSLKKRTIMVDANRNFDAVLSDVREIVGAARTMPSHDKKSAAL